MSTISTTNQRTPHRGSSLLRGLAIVLAVVVAGGVITGCAAPTALPEPTAAAAPAEATSAPAAVPEGTLDVMPAAPGGGMTQIVATPTVKDAAYASLSPTQKLDIYLPEGDGPFPLIINVHGVEPHLLRQKSKQIIKRLCYLR